MRPLVASLLLAGLVPAQDLAIRVQLSADPDQRGPAALYWFRSDCLPRLVETTVDPLGDVVLTWDGTTLGLESASERIATYAAGSIDVGGVRGITFECDSHGSATWHIERSVRMPTRVMSLVESLGLATPEAQRFDIAALASHLASAIAHDAGPVAELLTYGAAECGALSFVVERGSDPLKVHAQSGGGLLLPAAIVLCAELRGHPGGGLANERPRNEAERYRLLAFCARHGARTEAIAQLARIGDAESVATLERMLWSENDRSAVMEALIRADATHVLPELVRLASDDRLQTTLARAAEANFSRGDVTTQPTEHGSERASSLPIWRLITLLALGALTVSLIRQYLRARAPA